MIDIRDCSLCKGKETVWCKVNLEADTFREVSCPACQVPTFGHISVIIARAKAEALAQLPLTQAQLEGLASGDMMVAPREPSDKAMLKVLSDSGERYGDTFQGIGPLVWHYQALISAAQEDQHHD